MRRLITPPPDPFPREGEPSFLLFWAANTAQNSLKRLFPSQREGLGVGIFLAYLHVNLLEPNNAGFGAHACAPKPAYFRRTA